MGMAQGTALGLAALDAFDPCTPFAGYPLLPSIRGDLLIKLGRFTEAREEIERAVAMTENRREQELLSEKPRQIPETKQDG